MKNPKISVIVPVYNVEQYLCRCVDSILAQTFPDFELLLIDDGSKDRSGEMCDEYAGKDERVRVFHKENGGVSVARNVGIENATGEYICFIDSDDWVEAEYFQVTNDNISDFDIMFFGAVWHYEDGGQRSLSFCPVECKTNIGKEICHLLENDMGINYFGYTWNKVFRRDIIEKEKLQFVENLSLSEDEVFTLAYCNKCKALKIIDKPLYHYYWKAQGLTHKQKKSYDWLILADSFQQLVSGITDKSLGEMYIRRIASFYLAAARLYNNPLKVIREEFKTLNYCRNNNIRISIKQIIKSLIK